MFLVLDSYSSGSSGICHLRLYDDTVFNHISVSEFVSYTRTVYSLCVYVVSRRQEGRGAKGLSLFLSSLVCPTGSESNLVFVGTRANTAFLFSSFCLSKISMLVLVLDRSSGKTKAVKSSCTDWT